MLYYSVSTHEVEEEGEEERRQELKGTSANPCQLRDKSKKKITELWV